MGETNVIAATIVQLFRKRSCRCQVTEVLSSAGHSAMASDYHLMPRDEQRTFTYHMVLMKAEVIIGLKAVSIVCDSGIVLHIGKTTTPILHLLLSRTRVKRPGPHGTITGTERYCRSSASCIVPILFFLLWFCLFIYTATFRDA